MAKRSILLLFKVIALLIVVAGPTTAQAQDAAAGKKIFETTCTSCHKLGGKLIGPNLVGVKDRWAGREDLLVKFVQNSQAVIQAGDPYSVNLFHQYNDQVMTPQALTDAQVKDVIEYVHTGGKAAAGAGAEPTATTGGGAPAFQELPEENTFSNVLIWACVLALGIILILAIGMLFSRRKRDKEEVEPIEPKEVKRPIMDRLNAYIGLVFFALGMVMLVWSYYDEKEFIQNIPASEHGADIDNLFAWTTAATLFIFFLTQALLFFFIFIYRRTRANNRGLHYAHNNTIEFVWTIIPAIVLTGLVIYGFKTWRVATSVPEGDVVHVEAFAKQFDWTFRYAGPDNKLGRANFLLIDPSKNPLGLDFTDPNAHDDYLTTELHVPKGKEVVMHLRSQDVLHAAYLPHFRAQLYVQPGLENILHFKPTITTEEMRRLRKESDFVYEMACNQICGAAHYNMRRVVVVEELDDYMDWAKEAQKDTQFERFKKAESGPTVQLQK